jgi:Cu(I)/Ag(I) efflux system membrane protein CusA/SilA
VASIGGYVKQYQVVVDPNKLRAYNIPIQKIRMAIQRSNTDVGGRLVEMGETEFMVRGLGYIKSIDDLYSVPLKVDDRGVPILLRNVATVTIGPELRRGVADYNGQGEVVGGIIVMRYRRKRPAGDRQRQTATGGTQVRPARRGKHQSGL